MDQCHRTDSTSSQGQTLPSAQERPQAGTKAQPRSPEYSIRKGKGLTQPSESNRASLLVAWHVAAFLDGRKSCFQSTSQNQSSLSARLFERGKSNSALAHPPSPELELRAAGDGRVVHHPVHPHFLRRHAVEEVEALFWFRHRAREWRTFKSSTVSVEASYRSNAYRSRQSTSWYRYTLGGATP